MGVWDEAREADVFSDPHTFGPTETDLSGWMADNAFVTWIEDPRPWLLEPVLIRSLDLPLNLDQNTNHAFHARLIELRREARRRALMSPRIGSIVPEPVGSNPFR
jgi:hypothetical protein